MLFYLSFVSLPDRKDAILNSQQSVRINIESSGSLGIFLGDSKCHPTFPNQTLVGDKYKDWCSNIGKDATDKPWIQYSLPNKQMKITGYAVRNGCCYYDYCCCELETGKIIDYYCCCRLYSFSLLGSNDNRTWTVLHKVEKDTTFRYCQLKTFEIQKTQAFRFLRFVLDEEKPGCQKCMQINQIEFYGEALTSPFSDFNSFEDDGENEESISIIGKVKRE